MPDTKLLPVFIRVGDGPEVQVAEIPCHEGHDQLASDAIAEFFTRLALIAACCDRAAGRPAAARWGTPRRRRRAHARA